MTNAEQFLVKRYAIALLHTVCRSLTDQDRDALSKTIAFLKQQQTASALTTLSLINRTIPLSLFQKLTTSTAIATLFKTIFDLLIVQRRTFLFFNIVVALRDEWYKKELIMPFSIETTIALTKQQKQRIELFLQQQTGYSILCSYAQKPSLIAGIRAQSSIFLWENNIEQRLQKIHSYLIRKDNHES